MTAHTLLAKLAIYRGCKLNDAIDAIEALAAEHKFRVNVMDPAVNNRNSIDAEPDRLNVRTDVAGVITSFTIG